MRIAMTGSSGLIGQALRSALTRAGHSVIPLVRRAPSPGEIEWNPQTGTLDPATLEGFDAAINLAGENIATRWTGEARKKIRESRVKSTALLASVLSSRERKPGVLISISAVGYYGDRGEEPLDESKGPGTGFLPRLAEEWEAAADPARAAGIRVVHPRLGIVLSRDGGALDKMRLPFKLGLGGRLGSGKQWMTWIAMDDVIGGVQFLLSERASRGPVNLVAPGVVRNAEFTRILGNVLSRPTIFPVPPAALYLLYGRDMPLETLLASARALPQAITRAGYQFRFPELEPALRHVLNR
jgi:uncharacterized protein (TIGR01777 family)